MSNDYETSSGDIQNNDYVSRPGQSGIPVQSDSADVGGIEGSQDSDEQLARDDVEAIDEDNIINDRTRGAKPSGGYAEPGDEEGLPGPDDGTSAGAQ
ncbi:hypothetical protein BP6252_01301 [Coleophoma cylindrospora]|uniref:Histone chaperone domain-containing protein n=1 Tax=Coleophoma cylindrospora TaxID=1849047 RepID=A0A3D8SSH1_9HELO|nr:hypothetical protein BP6252_01301 [Coleophoma cylindrospora]